MPRKTLVMIAIALACCIATAQVAPPKRHANLEQRFNELKSALVLIDRGTALGTGFYVSSDGDVATASHVIGDRTFSRNAEGKIVVKISVPTIFTMTNSKGEKLSVSGQGLEQNPDAWLADVARIKTGSHPDCWLQEVDDRQALPGHNVITIGFPGLSFQALTIYAGIMSARLTTNLPTVILDTGEALPPSNEFIRVQMPISAGLSGAPILDDNNRVFAIVTNAGGWTQDLDNLMMAFRGGAFQVPPPAPNPLQAQNTRTFTINSVLLLRSWRRFFTITHLLVTETLYRFATCGNRSHKISHPHHPTIKH
jgi:S1-C subfamily serine protease